MKELTYAEEYVMERLARGDCPKKIASQREVTVTAISKIARQARVKLGARTTYQAVAMFATAKAGWLRPVNPKDER